MADSGTDSGKEDANHYIEVLTDIIVEVSGQLSNVDAQFVNQVNPLLDDFKTVQSNLGVSDVRKFGLLDKLEDFHAAAAKIDEDKNESRLKTLFSLMAKTIRQLRKNLEGSWNDNLSKKGNEEDADKAKEERQDTEKRSATVDNESQAEVNDEKKICPTWKVGNQEWYKSETENLLIKCDDCPKNFTNLQSYQRHCKKGGCKRVDQVIPDKCLVHCMLPHKPGTRAKVGHLPHQIAEHLKTVHLIPKPSKDHFFRGWMKDTSNGEITVVFLKPSEEDPPPPVTENVPSPEATDIVAAGTPLQKTNITEVEVDKAEDNAAAVAEDNEEMGDQNLGGPLQTGVQMEMNLNEEEAAENVDNVVPVAAVNPAAGVGMQSQPQLNNDDQAPIIVDQGHSKDSEKEKNVDSEADFLEDRQMDCSLPDDYLNAPIAQSTPTADESAKKVETRADGFDYALMTCEDELYNSNPENIAAEVFPLESSLFIEEDSDKELGDEEDFTNERLVNQAKRYKARKNFNVEGNLHERDGNLKFVEEFTQFVTEGTANEDPKCSTVSWSTSLLFRHSDSFLHYEYERDNSFQLDRLIDFQSPTFLELTEPHAWIKSISGADNQQQASRRKEMYKAHRRLREFIIEKLKVTKFDSDLFSMVKRDRIKARLDEMTESINKNKTWQKLQRQVDHNRKLLKSAKEVLKPSNNDSKVGDLNSKYFSSQPYKDRSEKHLNIWRTAIESNNIGVKDFNAWSNFTRGLTFFHDRNRQGVYQQIYLSDYTNKKSVWFPENFNLDSFQGLPSDLGHNMYREPEGQNRKPDAYLLVIPGTRKGLKNKMDVNVCLFASVDEWIKKYLDLRQILLGDDQDPGQPLFISYQKRNKKVVGIGPMTNGPGSLLREYGEVTGDSGITTNDLRRELETKVQSTHGMALRSKIVTQHSTSVGDQFYDQSAAEYRASAMHFVNTQEGNFEVNQNNEDISEEVAHKRRRLDEKAKEKSIQQAKAILKQHEVPRNVAIGRNCNIVPSDRTFIQETFGKEGCLAYLNVHDGIFPDESQWKSMFYRVVDGGSLHLSAEGHSRMKAIEMSVFSGIRESVIAESGGVWINSVANNKKCDLMVSNTIRKSLKQYEKNRKEAGKGFFKF